MPWPSEYDFTTFLASGGALSGGIGSGQIGNFHVASGSVTSGRLGVTETPDGTKFLRDDFTWRSLSVSIGSGDVQSGDVGSGVIQGYFGATRHVASGTLGVFDFGSGAVITGSVGSGAIQSGNVASGQIGRFHVASGQFAGFELGSGSIVSGRIASGQIGNFHVASGQIQGLAGTGVPNIASGSFTGFELGSGAIVSGRVASGQIGLNHLSSGLIGYPGIIGGRLTLLSGYPVADLPVGTSASGIFYAPHVHNKIALFSGSAWQVFTFSQLFLGVSGLASASAQNFDVYVFNNAGTISLELSASGWTNDTTRLDALVNQDGVFLKSGSTTRRYVGTIRINGATNNISNDVNSRHVWNLNNQIPRNLFVTDGASTWTYDNSAYQQANASSANSVDVVAGLSGYIIDLSVHGMLDVTTSQGASVSIGEDSSTIPASGVIGQRQDVIAANAFEQIQARLVGVVPMGWHDYRWLEKTNGLGGTSTWRGNAGSGYNTQMGLVGWWMA